MCPAGKIPPFQTLEPLEARTLLATFYVSPLGNDANTGLSPGQAFRTIAKVNTLTLNPGDSVLFDSANGNFQTSGTPLQFDQNDSGTATSPVTIGSYGGGRAKIDAGSGNAITARNVGGFVIKDLELFGNWNAQAQSGSNNAQGLVIRNDLSGNVKKEYVRVDNMLVYGFKWGGIQVQGANGRSGFRDLKISNSTVRDNGDIGISVKAFFDYTSVYAHEQITITGCFVYNTYGLSGQNLHSGNGIIISDINGGLVEKCVAYNNGVYSDWSAGGPVGIWAWHSNGIVFQFNESYANRTANMLDGGGFDFDGGVTNSVMQYNYSHDNDGAGILLYQFNNARPFGNNVVRYNLSVNDGRKGGYGGIAYGGGSGLQNVDIYGNTIFLAPSTKATNSNGSIAGFKQVNGIGSGVRAFNNLVLTTSSIRLVDSNQVTFKGNAYWNYDNNFRYRTGSTTYSSLAAWRATGQEKHNGADTGFQVNPLLANPGAAPTLNNPALLQTLVQYHLNAASPLINQGLGLGQFGITDMGGRDFYQQAAPNGAALDIGIHEYQGQQVPPPDPPPSVPPTNPPPPPPGGPPAPQFTQPPLTDLEIYGDDGQADTFYVRADSTATRVHIWVNTPITGTPTYDFPITQRSAFAIFGLAGNDTLTIDLTNGNPFPSNQIYFDGGEDTDLVTVIGSAGNDAFNSVDQVIWRFNTRTLRAINFEGITMNSGSGNDSFTMATTTVIPVVFNGGDGTDSVTFNSTNSGEAVSIGGGRVTGGYNLIDHTGVENLVVNTLGGADAISFDGIQAPATTIQAGDGDDLLVVSNVNASTALAYLPGAGFNELRIVSGTYVVPADLGAGGVNLLVEAVGSTVNFNSTQHLTGLIVNANATVTLNRAGTAQTLLAMKELTVNSGSGGRLDLKDNLAIVDYSAGTVRPEIAAWLASGRNFGAWNGNGIRSSTAAADPQGIRTLGMIESSQFISANGTTIFGGENIDSTAILIKYTYYGDTDLNGVVDFDDYARIDSAFLGGGTGTWFDGDSSYDGVIDFDDYALIDTAFLLQGPPL